jgi:adenylosuccinate synthase
MKTQAVSGSLGQAIAQIGMAQLPLRRGVSAIGSLDVVVGGQYGSEAKGHVTQQIIKRRLRDGNHDQPVLNVRVAGPNAGHTTYANVFHSDNDAVAPDGSIGPWTENRAFAFRQLPVGIVENADQVFCGIAAGSEIELSVLLSEIQMVKDAGLWPAQRLLIVDPEATLLEPGDHTQEAAQHLVNRIGSTGKGIGSARSRRIMRSALRVKDSKATVKALSEAGAIVRSLDLLYSVPGESDGGAAIQYQIVIEGTQGYGLGLHAGAYPQSTSSDCRAIDFLAMAGISPWQAAGPFKVWVVVRPYPIRVAGNSGPMYGETSWKQLGLPAEYTTVTKKERRVGTWDPALAEAAVRANGGGFVDTAGMVVLALTMADQISPAVRMETAPEKIYGSESVTDFIEDIQDETGAVVELVTTSPCTAVWLA